MYIFINKIYYEIMPRAKNNPKPMIARGLPKNVKVTIAFLNRHQYNVDIQGK